MGGRSCAWINGVAARSLSFAPPASGWPTSMVSTPPRVAAHPTRSCACSTPWRAGALVAEVAARHREWQRLLRLQREAETDSASSARERELLAWRGASSSRSASTSRNG